MNLFFKPRVGLLKLLNYIMSNTNDRTYYAVVRGKETGIFNSWKECKAQVEGFNNPKYRKFFSLEEAEEFLNFWKNYSLSDQPKVSIRENKRGIPKLVSERQISNGEMKRTKSSKTNKYILGESSNKLGNHNGRRESQTFNAVYASPINGISSIKKYSGFRKSEIENDKLTIKQENNLNIETISIKQDIEAVDCPNYYASMSSHPEVLHRNLNSHEKQTDNSSIDTSKETFALTSESDRTCINNTSVNSEPSVPVSLHSAKNILIEEKDKITVAENKIFDVICESNSKILQNSETSDSNILLKKCVDFFSSALTLIVSKNNNSSKNIVNSMQNLMKQLLNNTNSDVNSQINAEDNDKGNEMNLSTQPLVMPASLDSLSSDQVEPGSYVTSQIIPSTTIQSADHVERSRSEPKNIDIMALNIRLDSFDRRFDTCLKDVGGIMSELSHIKSEIKEIKELLIAELNLELVKKKIGEITQSTLNFSVSKSETGNSFNEGNLSSPGLLSSTPRYYSKSSEDNSSEPPAKKSKSLKRKLSTNDEGDSKTNKKGNAEDCDNTKIKVEAVDYTSFTVDEDDFVHVYTDGTCHSNGKKDARAGIGIWFGDCHPLNVSEPAAGSPTNNSAEIQAARLAIELASRAGVKKLKILTDSEFLINCATKWIYRWKKNDWTLVSGGKVKNRVELEKLDAAARKIKVRWEKVEGHSGIKGNEMADRLANEGALKNKK